MITEINLESGISVLIAASLKIYASDEKTQAAAQPWKKLNICTKSAGGMERKSTTLDLTILHKLLFALQSRHSIQL